MIIQEPIESGSAKPMKLVRHASQHHRQRGRLRKVGAPTCLSSQLYAPRVYRTFTVNTRIHCRSLRRLQPSALPPSLFGTTSISHLDISPLAAKQSRTISAPLRPSQHEHSHTLRLPSTRARVPASTVIMAGANFAQFMVVGRTYTPSRAHTTQRR